MNAPSEAERQNTCRTIGYILSVSDNKVSQYLSQTWSARHTGTLGTLEELALHMLKALGAEDARKSKIILELEKIALLRVSVSNSVYDTLAKLKSFGFELVLMSDATIDIALAWEGSDAAKLFSSSVFSCEIGEVKPSYSLYRACLDSLGMPDSYRTIYCGDGGGDELNGAVRVGMHGVKVLRRGGEEKTLAFGIKPWKGPILKSMEEIIEYILRIDNESLGSKR